MNSLIHQILMKNILVEVSIQVFQITWCIKIEMKRKINEEGIISS